MTKLIEYFEWNKLSETLGNTIVNMNNEINVIESKMDKKINEKNKILMDNINERRHSDNIPKIVEYFSIKKSMEALGQKKFEYVNNMNESMNDDCKLKDDLDALKQIYNNLNKQCIEKENEINTFKAFDTNENILEMIN